MNIEISKMITLHPAHLSGQTYHLLRCDAVMGVITYQKNETHGPEEYGVFVYIQGDWADHEVPEDLRACIELAREDGCDWIMFDYDAEPVEGLPVLC